jgi:hypothetical protein
LIRVDEDLIQRHGRLILHSLYEYREGQRSLNELAQQLDGIWNVMSDYDPKWRAQFRSSWATLEEVNAMQLDGEGRPLTSEEHIVLDDALIKIDELARQLSNSLD